MPNGIIIVNKAPGMTSFDVVYHIRKLYNMKKVGHTGTLDPDAVGVLPICLGKGTKVVDLLTNETKTYRAVMRLGITTDTQDTSGTILTKRPVNVTEEQVRSALEALMGDQMQLPPMYSAIKINGQKLVDLARKGIEVERKPRKVHFSELKIHSIDLPEVTFEVTCSKGAYIRTLCHDAGEALGCGAAMAHLTRTRVGSFSLENAVSLDELREMTPEEREARLMPVDSVFSKMPRLNAAHAAEDKLLLNGRGIRHPLSKDNDGVEFRVYTSTGDFIGIYRYEAAEQKIKLVKFFYDLS
ncbi:MAG: tRNA pseudouridine(55) synthase TruB [Lachnospiraceae bacterium]|nr:tRNA pseudouridine(55) synthase TruB [Lachnospiraceae bacterium]